MAELQVKIAGVPFKNPVIAASGTYGFGRDYLSLYSPEKLGGIALKGLTLERREGNPPPRIAETPAGMLNSVGLQNPGADAFLRDILPEIEQLDTVLIANAAGNTTEDYQKICALLSQTQIDMIELNISCPNVKHGGAAFGTSCESAAAITAAVRPYCKKPLVVKLSPNVANIAQIAQAVEAQGADAVSLVNTFLGMRIDTRTRRPILHRNVGGLSGPAIFPIALRMVWETAQAVKIPVIGLGGISGPDEAVQMLLAGAGAIQVGAAMFDDPFAPLKIIEGLETYLDQNGCRCVDEIVGQVQPY